MILQIRPNGQRFSSERALKKSRLPQISPNLKPSKNRNLSSRYSHLSTNRKKNYIDEVRFTEIERENRLLLEKIHNIIRKPSDISHRKKAKLASARNNSYKRRIVQNSNDRSRYSIKDSDSSRESKRNSVFLEPQRNGSAMRVVFNGKKLIGKRKFNVKVLEYGDNVKIIVSDDTDSFRLLLKTEDIFSELSWKGDWGEVVNSISTENDKLVLCVKPFNENYLNM